MHPKKFLPSMGHSKLQGFLLLSLEEAFTLF